jgi:hypothetical protein
MARALGSIITLAAAVVVNVVPGLGQLASAAILIGAAAASYAISALLAPPAAKPETTEIAIKTERPPRVRALGVSRLYGASICYETVNGMTVDVWAFHDGRAHAILRTYLNDNQVTVSGGVVQALPDKSYQGGNVRLGYSMGLPTETAFAAVTAVLPAWDANHRGDGVVCGYLLKRAEKDKYFLETYPQGDSVSLSLVGEWTPKFDPRDPAQDPYNEATWGWSDNAVLAFLWYMMVERGYDWNTKFLPQITKLLTAINIADQDVPLAAAGTEKRYRTALSYKATEEPASVIASLLACFDGWYCINEAGEVLVYAGAYYEPTVSIGPGQIVAWRQPMGVEDENYVNEIAISYVSSLHDYGTVEGQAWRDEDDIETRGRTNTTEMGSVVPSHTQARRLAKIKMSRNNAPDRGTVTTTFGGRDVLQERFINLLVEEAGGVFFDGVAEISGAERDPMSGGITFEWVAAGPNAFAWNPATEDGEGAPVGNRIAPSPIVTPSMTDVDLRFGENAANVRATIAASGFQSDAATWYIRWRVAGDAIWNERESTDTDTGPSVMLQSDFLPLDADVQLEIAYQTGDGRLSDWSAPVTVSTTTADEEIIFDGNG